MKNQNTKINAILAAKSPAKCLSENLNRLMSECDVDSVQLHKNTGVPATTINRLRKADPSNNPTLATLVPLADFFAISVSELIGDKPISSQRPQGASFPNINNWHPIPHLSWDQIIPWLTKKAAIQKNLTTWTTTDIAVSDLSFAVTMEGDSMYPRFPEGTLFIVEPTQPFKNRDFIFIQQRSFAQPLFKQILIDGPDYYLKSLNDDFKEIKKIDLQEDYKILGTMIQARMEFN